MIIFILSILLGLSNCAHSLEYWGGCFENHLPCPGSSCLPLKAKCNHKVECADTSDEHLCAPYIKCFPGYTVCKLDNGQMTIVSEGVGCGNMARGCGPKPLIPHADVKLNNEDSSVGALASFTCHEGYQSCTRQLRCLPSYTWEIAVCDPIPTETFECYKCNNKNDNDECNKQKEMCKDNERSCQTIVEWTGTTCRIIKKGCINPEEARKSQGCDTKGYTTKCKLMCEESECNKILTSHASVDDDDEEPEPEPESEPEPEGEGPEPVADCETEHGSCTRKVKNEGKMFALKISDCHQYCKCVRKAGKFKWQTKDCQTEKMFDDKSQSCNDKGSCQGQANVGGCNDEHGPCIQSNLNTLMALRSSDCRKYCQCAVNRKGKYKWVRHKCPKGSLFDDSLPDPACSDKKEHVICHDVHESACAKEAHAICNEKRFKSELTFILPDTGCRKYCKCEADGVRPNGAALYDWKEKSCPIGKLFDESKGKCKLERRVTCES
ncbi:uncharacterized protein LOC123558374 [Mercenaria mercenaria]|uniref:uncharacterized protein LOC123558374 n=1 Tax=Mercenaria mercenaria TaxID=6596 RepID=UPI00234F2B99|nr:uncharacterized protein LOC123558374 [Mercenaria mercenaria]